MKVSELLYRCIRLNFVIGETYEQAAVRELEEETGYESAKIIESSGE